MATTIPLFVGLDYSLWERVEGRGRNAPARCAFGSFARFLLDWLTEGKDRLEKQER